MVNCERGLSPTPVSAASGKGWSTGLPESRTGSLALVTVTSGSVITGRLAIAVMSLASVTAETLVTGIVVSLVAVMSGLRLLVRGRAGSLVTGMRKESS